MKQESLSRAINGNPTLETLIKIANAIGVEVSELFVTDSKTDLTALVEYKEDFYKAETLDGLKEIVKKIELREPSDNPNNPVGLSETTKTTERLNKQPDPEPYPIPEDEPPKRTFFPATNYDTRPKFRVREGALIHFGGKQYTGANITDAIALELLRDAPTRIKYFDIYPENWEELVK